jgi:hypothetical protein
VLDQLPKFISEQFPVRLSKRGGVTGSVVDLMNVLAVNETSFQLVAQVAQEMHAATFYSAELLYYQTNAAVAGNRQRADGAQMTTAVANLYGVPEATAAVAVQRAAATSPPAGCRQRPGGGRLRGGQLSHNSDR